MSVQPLVPLVERCHFHVWVATPSGSSSVASSGTLRTPRPCPQRERARFLHVGDVDRHIEGCLLGPIVGGQGDLVPAPPFSKSGGLAKVSLPLCWSNAKASLSAPLSTSLLPTGPQFVVCEGRSGSLF